MCNLVLDQSHDLAIAATDLEDYYHTFVVSKEHAARNRIHGVFPAETFKGWHCWDPKLSGKLAVGCFATLAMGTNYAVEIAQHTHSNLLKRAGCLNGSQQVRYRHPFPRGEVYQLLRIDDYAILQQVPRGVPLNSCTMPRHDLELLNQAEKAYSTAGLRTSKSKTIRNSKKVVILGGEVDGVGGTVSAPKLRIHVLCRLTLALVNLGWGTKHLIQSLLGCWIFALLFRRPLPYLVKFSTQETVSQLTKRRNTNSCCYAYGPHTCIPICEPNQLNVCFALMLLSKVPASARRPSPVKPP